MNHKHFGTGAPRNFALEAGKKTKAPQFRGILRILQVHLSLSTPKITLDWLSEIIESDAVGPPELCTLLSVEWGQLSCLPSHKDHRHSQHTLSTGRSVYIQLPNKVSYLQF